MACGHDQLLKVARTIADRAEAVQDRSLDGTHWT